MPFSLFSSHPSLLAPCISPDVLWGEISDKFCSNNNNIKLNLSSTKMKTFQMQLVCFVINMMQFAVLSFRIGSNDTTLAAFLSNSRIDLIRQRHSTGALFMSPSGDSSSEDTADDDDDDDEKDEYKPSSYNVLGTPLKPCCCDVRGTGVGTGFYRNGFCSTGDQDLGRHTVCVQVTNEFLQFSAAAGNDLSTPMPEYQFPGLKEGDRWCLCAARWVQAYQAGMAPELILESTHEKTLSYAPWHILREYAIDKDDADAVLAKLNEQRERLNKLL